MGQFLTLSEGGKRRDRSRGGVKSIKVGFAPSAGGQWHRGWRAYLSAELLGRSSTGWDGGR